MRRIRIALMVGLAGSLLGAGNVAARPLDDLEACTTPAGASARSGSSGYLRVVPSADRVAGAEVPALAPLLQGGADINVYFHVIYGTGSSGNVTDAQIADQIDVLNSSFGPWGWTFFLADTTRTQNTTWFNDLRDGSQIEKDAKTALRQGTADDLNIYTANISGGYLGWTTFPWEYNKNPIDDGVVLLFSTLPGGAAHPYDEGDSAVHEVGTWLGLFNTFEGGCSKKGDRVDDTPSERSPSFSCDEGRDTCKAPGLDPIHNFMDFGEDACADHFTAGQAYWMDTWFTVYREGK